VTQLSPSTMLSDQASVYIQKLKNAYSSGTIRDMEEISVHIRNLMEQFVDSVGTPLARLDPFINGEPPTSKKVNELMGSLQHDINILQRQSDFVRATSTYMFNMMATELTHAKHEQNKIRNKLSTLQLYSSDSDPNVVTFHENFASDINIDKEQTRGFGATVVEDSFLTLGRTGQMVSLNRSAEVEILATSNGFVGNNLELMPDWTSPVHPTTGEVIYTFAGEITDVDNTKRIMDLAPDTWMEYSAYGVSTQIQNEKKNFGFQYSNTETGEFVNWANGPTDGSDTLKLDFEFKLKEPSRVNYLSFDPYGMRDNANHPLRIKKIQTSIDGTNWDPIYPEVTWITTNQNIESLRVANNISVGTTVWSFEERDMQYIRMFIEQPTPMDARIGHMYYLEGATGPLGKAKIDAPTRVEGPIPTLERPRRWYRHVGVLSKGVTQHREALPGKRWGIGIRDININQISYDAESTMVSNPIYVPQGIDRVAIDADVDIPQSFDSNVSWVDFYVSVDSVTWYQISKITDDYLGIPEIIAFKDPTPEAFRESGVQYVDSDEQPNSIRVKIVMKRPRDKTWSTPLVRSYRLRIKTR
jgi:hypothetical protein